MLIATVIGFAAALLATLVATPFVRALALGRNLLDAPNHRKVHTEAVPRLGGVALGAGLILGTVGAILLSPEARDILLRHGFRFATLVAAAGVLALVGLYDDLRGLSARAKLLAQVLAGLVAFAGGNALVLFAGGVVGPAAAVALNLAATVLWVVAITNAMNLIDGLDGLATGVSAIICATLTVIAWQGGHIAGMCIGIGLLGGLLGFLPWNFPPARIFLGDTGALFVGFTLAVLSLEGYRQLSLIPFVVPVLALAVPILDTLVSIIRRLRVRAPIFSADRQHMHHRLLETRGSTRAAVLQVYFLSACFSLIALSFTQLQGAVAVACLVVVVLLTLRMLWNLGLLSRTADVSVAGGAAPAKEKSS